ncbi:MAG TPA: metalloregulator ArsR/SmtB family transcription factor [Thermoanaerobaculia bacterium]|nr:metalloregulator ArsR/SmtB family transcription factor [Thermoanaerobaculia bacterium]
MIATDEVLVRIADRMKAMADPMRLKILHSLEDRELSVSELVRAVGTTQANVSKHLAILRRVGLVTSRREGMSIYYRVADESIFSICRLVCDSLERWTEAEHATVLAARTTPASP